VILTVITIVDYGMGNIGSIVNMFKRVGVKSTLTSTEEGIRSASKLILPGVGAFDAGMTALRERGLIAALNDKVLHEKVPLLGVCLGMQLLAGGSEEGVLPGLGWLRGRSVKIRPPQGNNLKVPHMGWSFIKPSRATALLQGLPENMRFYFVHSYRVVCDEVNDVIAVADYGEDVCAAVNRDNIWGVQFHPEKSHMFGKQLFMNFAQL